MNTTYVASSNIDAIGYSLGTLYIRFKTGVCYEYHRVPFSLYEAMRNADSPGGEFHKMVKGQFEYRKLTADPFSAGERRAA